MKRSDPGIEKVRNAREKISKEADNDPAKLIEHYIEYQKRFGDRLRQSPAECEDENPRAAAEPGGAPDRP